MGDLVQTEVKSCKPLSQRSLQRCAEVVRSATALFASNDYHAVLMEHVANAAGVGKGTVYRYFEDKEALFLACVQNALSETLDVMHQTKHEETIPHSERLRVMISKLVEFFTSNGNLFRVLYHEKALRHRKSETKTRVRDHRSDIRRMIASTVEGGVEAGEFREVDGGVIGAAALGLVKALVSHMEESTPPTEIADIATKFILEGITTRG